jgi:hypothetical protein
VLDFVIQVIGELADSWAAFFGDHIAGPIVRIYRRLRIALHRRRASPR